MTPGSGRNTAHHLALVDRGSATDDTISLNSELIKIVYVHSSISTWQNHQQKPKEGSSSRKERERKEKEGQGYYLNSEKEGKERSKKGRAD
jgi:hypothetical protein